MTASSAASGSSSSIPPVPGTRAAGRQWREWEHRRTSATSCRSCARQTPRGSRASSSTPMAARRWWTLFLRRSPPSRSRPKSPGLASSVTWTNVTGVLFLHRELTGKRFELFKEMLPTVKRVAVLSDPLAAEQLRAVEAANRSMGLKLQSIELRNPSYDVESAFRAALRFQAEALLVLTTPVIFRER